MEETRDEALTTDGWPVELPVFVGPLDLLLHLIQKDELSIYDIPIASICDQYQGYIRAAQEIDLELAGEFLWMAAWLLQLKSRLLLPRQREDEDPRQELVERLVAYRQVKELASVLYEIDVVRRCLWQPSVHCELEVDEELDWEDVDLRLLARTYLQVMERLAANHPPPIEVLPLRYRVQETMRDLYHRVAEGGRFDLLGHLHTRPDPEEVVTLVVAALELVRLGGVSATQRRPFAEILLAPGCRRLEAAELITAGGDHGE
jgi:segregation and condensation protein A